MGHIVATESHQQKNGEGRVVVDNIREGCSLQNKEKRSQNRSLWDFTADGHWGRATVFDSYSLVLFER